MRPTTHICTQCARCANDREAMPSECQAFARRVYTDSFRMVGAVLEVDGVEYHRGRR